MNVCYLNGSFLPREEARISPMDRGFLFGDGAYEVVPVYARKPFRLAQHIARLGRTLAEMRLPNPLDDAQWATIVTDLIGRNPWEDQSVYLQVTRGVSEVRNHAFPTPTNPTVFLMSDPLVPPPREVVESGVTAVTAADFRWLRCDLKTVSLLANCLLRQQAADQGCAETLLFRDGFLTEGSASNIFIVRDGVVLAPPKSHLMLPGITYDVVLELAARHDVPHSVREITEQEVRGADEVWLTSSSKEVLAITQIDGHPVGEGRPGPLARRMYDWYQQFKQLEKHGG